MASEYWSIPGTPIPENPAEDPELSSHIRHLLLAYVQTHITTPYAQFTQLAVSELLSGLKPISVHDPTALTLPTEPLTVYLSTFASTAEPYTEKLQTTNEARLLIKRLLASKPPRVAKFADGEDEEENYGYHRPTTPPILTRRAIRETPVIGKTPETVKTYAAYTKTALHHALRPVPLQEIAEPQVNFDQVLDVKHNIRTENHAAVRALLKSAAKPPAPAHIHAYLPSSLVGDSHVTQEHTPPPDSPPFMPIFPRRVPICPPGKGKRRRNSRGRSAGPTKKHNSGPTPQAIPESMKDLFLLVKAAVVNEGGEKANTDPCELDLCESNMVVVDGWQTYVTSSPSVLSSNSNEEEDQLFLPSSPDTDVGAVALVKAVEDSKLEEVLIPRSRKIGSKPFVNGKKVKDPGVGRAINAGYGRFLAPLLQPTSSHRNSMTLSITSGRPSSPQIQATLDTEQTDVDLDGSLLGQASGLSDLHANGNNDDDGDAEIRQLYTQTSLPIQGLDSIVGVLQASEERPKPLPHPHDFIRDEPLFDDDAGKGGKHGVRTSKDGKDSTQGLVGALIPVPNLPEPNTYTATHTKATTLAEYVAPINGNPQNVGNRSRGFLRKAKGIAGLRVALSWVPFTLSSPADLPDHARVVDVNVLHRNDTDEMRRSEEKLVQGLLKRAAVIEDPALDDGGGKFQSVGEHLWSVLGEGDDGDRLLLESCEGLLRYDIILTREERMGLEKRERGVAKRDVMIQVEAREEELDEDGDEANVQSCIDNGHLKRKGVYSREIPDNGVSRYRKKCRSQDPDVVNDSGIGMMDGGCVFTDNAEAEAGILDFDIEEEDPFGSGAEGEDAFGVDDEEENRRPVGGLEAHDGYVSDPGMGDQDYYEWKDEEQDAMSRTTRNDDFYYQSPRGKLGDDYSRGFSLHQYYDAPLDPQVHAKSNQHLPDGANGLLDTGFGQTHYIELDGGHGVDMNDGYDYRRPNDGLDYVEGSFEPLPLSFDSQSYQAVSVRSSQIQAPPGRLSIQGQPHPHPQAQVPHANDRSNELTTEDSQDTQASNELATNSHTETTDTLTRTMVTSIHANPPQASRGINLPSSRPLLGLNLATHSLGIAAFVRLRAKTLNPTPSAPANPTPSRELQVQTPPMLEPRAPRNPPAGLYDRRTLRLPSEPRAPPTTTHKYLASLDLLQKQALVRILRSPEHCIDLVERVTLDGVDLILDAHVALIFVPLLSLPAQTQAEALLARVARVSWAFEKLLVVFEAYPASRSVRASRSSSSIAVSAPSAARYNPVALSASPSVPAPSDLSLSGHSNISILPEPGIYAYTPPIMKAIRKFRRDLDISEACGTKSAACVVEYAFADSVTEAAGFSRMFGDMVEVEGTRERDEHQNHLGRVHWGNRAWLDLDPDEDEDGLAVVPGMNRFKAAAVLSQMALGDFLDLDPEERVQMFGGIIGVHSVTAFNEEIERRLGALENYEGEQSTSVQVPYLG